MEVKNLPHNFQPTDLKKSQSQEAGPIMFLQRVNAAGYGDRSNRNDDPSINMCHIASNNCREKGYYARIGDCSFQVQLHKDAEAYRESQKGYG